MIEDHKETVEGWCYACRCFPLNCDRADSNLGHNPDHPGHEA